MKTKVKQTSFCKGLEDKLLDVLMEHGTEVNFTEKTHIFKEGKRAEWFYLLLSGQVTLEIHNPGGNAIHIDTIHSGQLLGVSWLVEPYVWNFDGIAATNVNAVAFDAQAIRQECTTNHELGYQLLTRLAGVMVRRLQATRVQLLDMYAHPKDRYIKTGGD